MATLKFNQVDVFTAVPFKGNPLAVIADADALRRRGRIGLRSSRLGRRKSNDENHRASIANHLGG